MGGQNKKRRNSNDPGKMTVTWGGKGEVFCLSGRGEILFGRVPPAVKKKRTRILKAQSFRKKRYTA